MKLDLKPCPFCGGQAKVFAWNEGGVCVKCTSCYVQTHTRSDRCMDDSVKKNALERSIDSWNRRVGEDGD